MRVGSRTGRLRKALARSGKDTPEEMRAAIAKKERQLWLAWERGVGAEAVAVTGISEHALMRVAVIYICIGRQREYWIEFLAKLEDWARAEGCRRIEAWARPGWEKVLKGYRKTHVMLEKAL